MPLLEPIKTVRTRADGQYSMCLPSYTTGPGSIGGQPFELRVRKDGYQSVSQSFRFAYSVWDYGGPEISLELLRD